MRTAPQKDMHVVVGEPQKHDDPDHFVADDFEHEELQPAVDELAPMCDSHRQRSLQWHYDLGEVVDEHYSKVQQERSARGGSMYGTRFFNCLAKQMHRSSISGQLLWQSFHLVSTYDEEAYRELCRHDAMTPTHALMLGLIGGQKERAELQEKVVTEKLTTRQLHEAEKEMFGIRRKPGAGRPLKKPKNVKAAFTHLTAQAGKFIKLNDEVWFGKAFDILSQVQGLTGDKMTDELMAQITDAAEQCENLAATAIKDAETLRGILPEIDRRKKAQAEAEAQLVAEAEEEEAAMDAAA
jgi:hypothetical protein